MTDSPGARPRWRPRLSRLQCVWLSAQTPQVFQFFVSASDAAGAPVTDLRPEDVVMSENGVRQQVVKVEPLAIPMKLTIAVDNGLDSADALAHYRSGLTGLVEALPPDVEITLITTAPQPRTVVRPTTNRTQILRGVNGFAPEQARPRFSDALVEYSERLQHEPKDRNAAVPAGAADGVDGRHRNEELPAEGDRKGCRVPGDTTREGERDRRVHAPWRHRHGGRSRF